MAQNSKANEKPIYAALQSFPCKEFSDDQPGNAAKIIQSHFRRLVEHWNYTRTKKALDIKEEFLDSKASSSRYSKSFIVDGYWATQALLANIVLLEAGRKSLEMTYVRSEFENGSESDEQARSDPSEDDGYNVLSKAFAPPKPSPSRHYAQRKLREGTQMHDKNESLQDDASKSSSTGPGASSSIQKEASGSDPSLRSSSKAESLHLVLLLKWRRHRAFDGHTMVCGSDLNSVLKTVEEIY
ncbi:hypothetical protein CTI12_AA525560 [Artemisia annua]|uniref:Uncharacterized protein n=1 Tax=Artemisia annua TaxID=35608 RepID=A0A2U1L6H6_ARTAN|nr:hypothetical protein CTI12_AA525560 [Artemisia annua]